MSNSLTPYANTGSGPLVVAGQQAKAAGFAVAAADVAQLNDWIALAPQWAVGSLVRVNTEPPGVYRRWSGTDALTAVLPNGTTVPLAASTNVVRSAPTGGADGDYAVDAYGVLWAKAGGTWTDTRLVLVSASRALTTADIGKRLVCASGVALTVPSGLGAPSVPPIWIEAAGASGASIAAGTGTLVFPTPPGGVPLTGTLAQYELAVFECQAAGVWVRRA